MNSDEKASTPYAFHRHAPRTRRNSFWRLQFSQVASLACLVAKSASVLDGACEVAKLRS